MHVGDSEHLDLAGALAAGIAAVLLDPAGRRAADASEGRARAQLRSPTWSKRPATPVPLTPASRVIVNLTALVESLAGTALAPLDRIR